MYVMIYSCQPMRDWEAQEQMRRDTRPCAFVDIPCQCASPLEGNPIYDSKLIVYAKQLTAEIRRNLRR